MVKKVLVGLSIGLCVVLVGLFIAEMATSVCTNTAIYDGVVVDKFITKTRRMQKIGKVTTYKTVKHYKLSINYDNVNEVFNSNSVEYYNYEVNDDCIVTVRTYETGILHLPFKTTTISK